MEVRGACSSVCRRPAAWPHTRVCHVSAPVARKVWSMATQKRQRPLQQQVVAAQGAVIDVTADEQEADGMVPAGEYQLEPFDRTGYHTIELEGCEYYIASTYDGRLNIRDTYVRDAETGIYAQPEFVGEIPEGLHVYHQATWAAVYRGDRIKRKLPYQKVLRVFLVKALPEEHYQLDLESVFVLDKDARQMARAEVVRNTDITNPAKLTLLIRKGQLTLEETAALPMFMDHSGQAQPPPPEPSQLEEALADDLDEPFLEEAEDVPAIDYE